MSTSPNGPALAERTDIHKSCKSIESLLNTLNEYCEAAGAVVALQKKLAKALRDTAGLKVTGGIAGNALNASATIYEALSDIDSKFAKIVDKEYDGVSTDVKKWFKKLAKEEKVHDERMSSANAKIKQAGQVYEKMSKKKGSDVTEEHARYINLISTLGPEVSQEKYNHTLHVTQRHTTLTYSVAACLSRLADFEWQKSCESIRRFSSTIGPLGEWRALCEGGWTGQIPQDLPDIDTPSEQPIEVPAENGRHGLKPIEEVAPQAPLEMRNARTPQPGEPITQTFRPPPGYSTAPVSESSKDPRDRQPSARNSPTLQRQDQHPSNNSSEQAESVQSSPPRTYLDPPRLPFADPNSGSVRSLSAFPAPPTHFPLPPRQPRQQNSILSHSVQSSTSNLNLPTSHQIAESPISASEDHSGVSDVDDSVPSEPQHLYRDAPALAAPVSPPSPERRFQERPKVQERETDSELAYASTAMANEVRRPIPVRSQTSFPEASRYQNDPEFSRRHNFGHEPSSSVEIRPINVKASAQQADYQDISREFGVNPIPGMSNKSRTVDNPKTSRPLERTDSGGSSASLVAAMRNRFSSTSGSTSPPPRNLPRLPLSVNNLATRYQPTDAPLSPKGRAGSPPVSRQQSLPPLDTVSRYPQDQIYQDLTPVPLNRVSQTTPEEDRRRWQRDDDSADRERRAKEQQLKEREMELEMRTRELERDRARLLNMRENEDSGDRDLSTGMNRQAQESQFGLRPRERRISLRHQLQRPLSQMDLDDDGGISSNAPSGSSSTPASSYNIQPRTQYSHSTSHLVPPSSSMMDTPPATVHSVHPPKFGQHSQPPSPLHQPKLETQYEDDHYSDSTNSKNNINSTSISTHAGNCGCESCSVNKYKTPSGPSERQRPSQQQPVATGSKPPPPEKPKGWIRRLSMPVGNAFNLDSKRHHSSNNVSSPTGNFSLGSGIGGGPPSGGGSRGLFSMDGKKNASTTALRPPESEGQHWMGVKEDGRLGGRAGGGRRSYEASGMSNRSMTNLGLSGRH
ncbi:hypothetical protein B0H34DRAFT_802016 [Crassisporium funariophilum]|nr:hypothetical protein B0H34DRAFT_802016 [Crassisporium funariophilum]